MFHFCYIKINEKVMFWRDGSGLLFSISYCPSTLDWLMRLCGKTVAQEKHSPSTRLFGIVLCLVISLYSFSSSICNVLS